MYSFKFLSVGNRKHSSGVGCMVVNTQQFSVSIKILSSTNMKADPVYAELLENIKLPESVILVQLPLYPISHKCAPTQIYSRIIQSNNCWLREQFSTTYNRSVYSYNCVIDTNEL